MQACAKHSFETVDHVHINYVENKKRPISDYARRIMKPTLVRPVHSAELSAKEVMCCSMATD